MHRAVLSPFDFDCSSNIVDNNFDSSLIPVYPYDTDTDIIRTDIIRMPNTYTCNGGNGLREVGRKAKSTTAVLQRSLKPVPGSVMPTSKNNKSVNNGVWALDHKEGTGGGSAGTKLGCV